jgi:phosphatidylglycerophosphate synthase
MISRVQAHYKEVLQSIKLVDVEERFDLYFSRFLGLYLAKIGEKLSLTPTHVSLVSLFVGIVGGGLLYFQEDWKLILVASVLISFAGLLDSADGQLARRTGQSTDFGRIIDGIIDNCVFFACYFSGCFYFVFGDIGWPILILGALAGFGSHSFSSNMYEFYKSEYLYYVGQDKKSKAPSLNEIQEKFDQSKGLNRVIYYLFLDYTKKQIWFSSRNDKVENKFSIHFDNPETKNLFSATYRKHLKITLFWWAWIGGTNVHRTMIMVFSLFGRFDLYIYVVLIKFIPFLIMVLYQKRKDNQFMSAFESQKDHLELVK